MQCHDFLRWIVSCILLGASGPRTRVAATFWALIPLKHKPSHQDLQWDLSKFICLSLSQSLSIMVPTGREKYAILWLSAVYPDAGK